MLLWRRFLPNALIRGRIVAAVVLESSAVLLAAGGFVDSRVSYALDRQLNQDLRAYTDLVTTGLARGDRLPGDKPGLVSQTFAPEGARLDKSDQGVRSLLTDSQIRGATTRPRRLELGRFLPPPSETPYRVRYFTTPTPGGTVVVATAISRRKHDEALRELLLQLGLADLATVAAAGLVGWGATRAALDPVERYRRAAQAAGDDPVRRLPVDPGHDDELTRLGATFNDLLDRLEEGRRRERQFLADASHELRSPLALLSAEVEWARHRRRTPAEMDVVLASIGEQTARLAALAEALLNLEEVTSTSVSAEPVDLQAFLEGVALRFEPEASDQNRSIVVDVRGGATAEVDPVRMDLAVGNLVGNALKYGDGTVTIRATTSEGRTDLEVVDEGHGIPDDLGDRAFQRFTRADRARTRPGNGLGLAIVAAVAHSHGGQVGLVPGGVRMTLGSTPPPSPGAGTA
jgi:signal transduction histidine kinase